MRRASPAIFSRSPPVAAPSASFGRLASGQTVGIGQPTQNLSFRFPKAAARPASFAVAGGGMAAARPLAAGLGGRAMAAAGKVFSQTGKLIGVVVNGKRFNRKAVVATAKRLGLEATAVALGLTVVEVAQMIAEDAATPRRRRGITASQIKTTRDTIRRIKSVAKAAGFTCRASGR